MSAPSRLMLLIALLIASHAAADQNGMPHDQAQYDRHQSYSSAIIHPPLTAGGECPVAYQRHERADVLAGKAHPYLFGGIYDSQRNCSNCKKSGLWAIGCRWRITTTNEVWDYQRCSDEAIKKALSLADRFEPAALTVTPCDLYNVIKGRTLWVMGDSISQDLFKAIRCFMIEFWDLHHYYASSNFTVMHYLDTLRNHGEPWCVHLPGNTRLCQVHVIIGDFLYPSTHHEYGVLPLLQDGTAHPDDVFIVNTGLWHVDYQKEQYRQMMHGLGNFYIRTKERFPNLFWMESVKQHFDHPSGDFPSSWHGKVEGPFVCKPIDGVEQLPDGSLAVKPDAPDPALAAEIVGGGWRNAAARQVLRDTYGIKLIPVYNLTIGAWDLHRLNRVGQECSHYCHPSMAQMWVSVITRTLAAQLPLMRFPDMKRLVGPGCTKE